MKVEGQTIILDAGEQITIKAKEAAQQAEPEQPQVNEPEPQPQSKLLYKVGLISDMHFDIEDQHNSEYQADLVNALEVFKANDVNFVASCGDICQYNDKDYEAFSQVYNSYKGMRFFTCMGNHDYLRIFGTRKSVPAGYASAGMIWQDNISTYHCPEDDIHFFEYGAHWDDPRKTGVRNIKSKTSYWFQRGNDMYVFLSVDYGDSRVENDVIRGFYLMNKNDGYVNQMKAYVKDTDYVKENGMLDYQFYNPNSLIWLKELLEANTDKRIFIFTHHFLPHKAGDSDGQYSHLRIWPYSDSPAVRQKYYAGSNTPCGLTFWFLNKLNNEHLNTIWFSGHSHRVWGCESDFCGSDFKVIEPTGKEVTPLVDNLKTLDGTQYDYRLYTRQGVNSIKPSAPWVHLPSLSKPIDNDFITLYGGSQGAVMEVYENKVIINELVFKLANESDYVNYMIENITINR